MATHFKYQFPTSKLVPDDQNERFSMGLRMIEKAEKSCSEIYQMTSAYRECEKLLQTVLDCETILRSYPSSVVQAAFETVLLAEQKRGSWASQKDKVVPELEAKKLDESRPLSPYFHIQNQ